MINRIGIDVSEWQGRVDWEKVKPHIDFAVIRLGYGQNTLDIEACRNISECNRLDIPYGVYWFSYAYNVERVRNEARNAVARLKELGGELDYPFWFDWEYDSRKYAEKLGYAVSDQLLRDMAWTFCSVIEEAGFYAGIYANHDYVHNHYGAEIFRRFDLWYAYPGDCCDRDVNLWQNSFDGRIDGIRGAVDMNRCGADYPKIIRAMRETAVYEKSVEALALEVLEGRHGNGEARAKNLGAMYEFVQDRVNEILAERYSEQIIKAARAVIRGDYGNEPWRSQKLRNEGYDPKVIQQKVNELLEIHRGGERDGSASNGF